MPTKSLQSLIQAIPVNNASPLLLHVPSIVRELHINQNDIRMFGYSVREGSEGYKHALNYCGSVAAQALVNAGKGISLPIKTPIGVSLSDLSAGFLSSTLYNLNVLKIKEPIIQLTSISEYNNFISQSGLYDLVSKHGLFRLLANLDTVAFTVQYPLNNKMNSVNITIHRESIISTADNLPLPRSYICLHSSGQGLRAVCEQAILHDFQKKKTPIVLDVNANISNNPDALNQHSTRAAVYSTLMSSLGCTQLCKIADFLQPRPMQQQVHATPQPAQQPTSLAPHPVYQQAPPKQPIPQPASPTTTQQTQFQPAPPPTATQQTTQKKRTLGNIVGLIFSNVLIVLGTAINTLKR